VDLAHGRALGNRKLRLGNTIRFDLRKIDRLEEGIFRNEAYIQYSIPRQGLGKDPSEKEREQYGFDSLVRWPPGQA
jgi:hypothetical protein